MCRLLGVTRSLVYYKPNPHKIDAELENAVIEEFNNNRKVFGTIKLKRALKRRNKPLNASRRKIGNIMKKYGLVSKYVQRAGRKKPKGEAAIVNNETKPNLVERKWDERKPLEVVVSDLTYVKVNGQWHYICLLVDVATRNIIGSAVGKNKDAQLVRKAIYRADVDLRDIDIFHTDRGGEFKNEILDDIIHAFGMRRSLSAKGTPVDNAVMESLYNCVKAELVYGETFHTLADLELELFQFVHWYNNYRPHGGLGQLTPKEYKAIINEQKECS
jgi:transposase InsO family protein